MYMYKGLAKIESYKLDFSEKMFLCLKFFFKKIAFSSLTWPNFEKIQVSRLPTCEIEALFEAVWSHNMNESTYNVHECNPYNALSSKFVFWTFTESKHPGS